MDVQSEPAGGALVGHLDGLTSCSRDVAIGITLADDAFRIDPAVLANVHIAGVECPGNLAVTKINGRSGRGILQREERIAVDRLAEVQGDVARLASAALDDDGLTRQNSSGLAGGGLVRLAGCGMDPGRDRQRLGGDGLLGL